MTAELSARSRTRVLRGGPEAPWELWQRRPHRALAGLVAALWAGTSVEAHARHRTLPNGQLVLMIHLGAPQRLLERDGAPCDERLPTGFLAGLQERPSTYQCLAPFTSVAAAHLRAPGAWMVLGGLPLAEVTGQVIDTAALDARMGLGPLQQRMLQAPDLGAALDQLEAWLLERVRDARLPHPATLSASALLDRRAGGVAVQALAREVGLSPRRLHELFLREVGLPAKRLARVLRFRRALDQLATAPSVDLAELARAAGYYDQSHLYRDFRELAAMTPTAYLSALGEGLDGVDVLSG